MRSASESAYSRRAVEYTDHLGSMSTVHPADVHLVTSWAAQIDGPILDAGCGPGHWSGYLAEQGHHVRGVDRVPEFIGYARRTFPSVSFAVGAFDALPEPSGSYAGVLAWYSLIHDEPSMIQVALNEFARVLQPDGDLLVGFFTGPNVEAFEHSIATAFRWSPDALETEIREAGFEVLETHTRTGFQPRPRPHGAVLARRRQ